MQSRGNNESNAGDGSAGSNNNNSPTNENDAADNGDSKREVFSPSSWDQELTDFRVTKRFVYVLFFTAPALHFPATFPSVLLIVI